MRPGGRVTGSLWLTRVHSLRPGDYVKCAHWTDDIWMSGETLVVLEEPVRLPKTDYRATGYFDVKVQVPDDPKNWWFKCMHGDDQIQLTAREVIEKPTIPAKSKKQPKPKQLKLFED